jgi:hypothetical protein
MKITIYGWSTSFVGATFGDRASFKSATFGHGAWFKSATFGNDTQFAGAKFGNGAGFVGGRFGNRAWFGGVTFGDHAQLVAMTFGDLAWFEDTKFGDWASFGPILAAGQLVLDQAVFGLGPELAVSADRLRCRNTYLPEGAVLNVRWAEIRLDGVHFGRPSIVARIDPFLALNEEILDPWVKRSWRTDQPRIVSLRGTDVSNLTLSGVDLRACRFSGAHNLDQLHLEATIDLPDRPARVRAGWAVPPVWHWTRRRTLAEEHRWRRAQGKHSGWYPRACRLLGLAKQERSLQPADIALLYRALRKGREDSKDEPGAADFYYGEMEMRRHDRTAPKAERAVLWLYWLVAGYALRATRALACLFVLIAVAAVLLAAVGFAPAPAPLTATIAGAPPSLNVRLVASPAPSMTAERPFPDRLGAALLVALEGAVFRTSDQALSYEGKVIHTALRFLGPVLLGLGLLSIRGRVKR